MIDMNLRYLISFDKYKKHFKVQNLNQSCGCDGNHTGVIAKTENE